jgi:hypothetical protein
MAQLPYGLPRQDIGCQEYSRRAGVQAGGPDSVVTDAVYFNAPLCDLARFVQVNDFYDLVDAHLHD